MDWIPRNSDDEGPPGLHPSTGEHNSESEDESQDERDIAAPWVHNQTYNTMSKTIAQGSARETLLPTCVEISALQVIDEMRLQSQSAVDNYSVLHPPWVY